MKSEKQIQDKVKNFVKKYTDKIKKAKGKLCEDEYKHKFWISLLVSVFNIDNENVDLFINFEKKVKCIDGKTRRIDAFIESTKVLIEHKASNINITNESTWGNTLSQVLQYRRNLPEEEKPRWLVLCNFKTFLISDMKKPKNLPIQIFLKDLEKEYEKLNFLIDEKLNDKKREHISKDEEEISNPHNTFSKQYKGKERKKVKNINAYSKNEENIFIEKISKPLNNDAPKMHLGCVLADGGNLIIEEEDYKKFIKRKSKEKKYIKKLIGSNEFLNNKKRYCLWLEGVSLEEINSMPLVRDRVEECKKFRLKSLSELTKKLAETPIFRKTYNYYNYIVVPNINLKNYMVVPDINSENRKYIPMGFIRSKNTVSTDTNFITKNTNLYYFGILESIVHMVWVKSVCERLKKDYRYSTVFIYNNFPWPKVNKEQREKIKKTAQGILDARANHSDKSLADLYNEMPEDLRKAHEANDKAVKRAYGFKQDITEEEIFTELIKMHNVLKGGKYGR